MDCVRFATEGARSGDHSNRWREINRELFGPLEVDCPDGAPFDARMSSFEVGSLRMMRIKASAHRVRRDRPCSEPPASDFFKLVLQLRGRAEIRQRDQVFALHPGDWSLYDPSVPYSITNFEPCDLMVVQVPRREVRGFREPNLHTNGANAERFAGLNVVLGAFLAAMSEQLPVLPNGAGKPLGETFLGLLASALGAWQEGAPGYATLPGVLKARVKQYVWTHLGESDLCIDRIARDMRCSKRYLHRIFSDEQSTLERYIWQTRLERCHAALTAPAAQRKRVSEVAFSWGFNSTAHFCRMFKSHFGVSPRRCQREAGQEPPPPAATH